jgi:hypothetical protein
MANHNTELMRKASGDIFLKKNNAAEVMANTFTSIIINFISLLEIK